MLDSVSKQELADELCLSILGEYAATFESATRWKLHVYLPLAQEHTREYVKARLAQIDNSPDALLQVDRWISKLLTSLEAAPEGEVLLRLVRAVECLQYGDDEVGSFAVRRLNEGFSTKWPHTPASLTLQAYLDEADIVHSIDLLQAALRMDETFWPARLHLAQCYSMANQWEQACTQFARLDRISQLKWEQEHNFSLWAKSLAMAQNIDGARQVIERLADADLNDADKRNFLANAYYRLGEPARAVNLWLQLIPFSPHRGLWLWVTRENYYLEDDGTDLVALDPFSLSSCVRWSCDAETKSGDLVLLYRTHPKKDIAYLMVAEGDAEEASEEDDEEDEQEFDYYVDARVLLKFEKPLTLATMRDTKELAAWKPLRANFQGVSFPIAAADFELLLRLATQTDSGGPVLQQAVGRLLPKGSDAR